MSNRVTHHVTSPHTSPVAAPAPASTPAPALPPYPSAAHADGPAGGVVPDPHLPRHPETAHFRPPSRAMSRSAAWSIGLFSVAPVLVLLAFACAFWGALDQLGDEDAGTSGYAVAAGTFFWAAVGAVVVAVVLVVKLVVRGVRNRLSR